MGGSQGGSQGAAGRVSLAYAKLIFLPSTDLFYREHMANSQTSYHKASAWCTITAPRRRVPRLTISRSHKYAHLSLNLYRIVIPTDTSSTGLLRRPDLQHIHSNHKYNLQIRRRHQHNKIETMNRRRHIHEHHVRLHSRQVKARRERVGARLRPVEDVQ